MALAQVFETIAGPDAPVEFAAYDGSRAGAPGSPVRITVRSPVAVSYLAQAPGALGLARAYVSGHLDVDGDMYTALARMAKAQTMNIDLSERLRLLRELGGPKLLLPAARAAAAGGAGREPVGHREASLQEPRRERDLASLRRLEPVL